MNKQKILNAIGLQKVKGSFKVKGEIIFEHNVKFQVLQGKAKLLEIIGDGIATSKDERILTQQITMNAFVDMKFRKDFRFDLPRSRNALIFSAFYFCTPKDIPKLIVL